MQEPVLLCSLGTKFRNLHLFNDTCFEDVLKFSETYSLKRNLLTIAVPFLYCFDPKTAVNFRIAWC